MNELNWSICIIETKRAWQKTNR